MKIKIMMRIMLILSIMLAAACSASALSNESIEAKQQVDDAQVCFDDLVERGIPVERADSSLQEALQLYSAQIALEETGDSADYRLVTKFSGEVCQIQEVAIKANDELQVFIDSYEGAAEGVNLSSIQADYDEVLLSFQEERFEETLTLIDEGYVKISEVQASQTALRLFYETTSKTLKNFLKNNWKRMAITAAAILVLLAIFWTTLKRIRINMKIRTLEIRKETLNSLIGKLQRGYFKKQTVSETEYRVKLSSFKEMILDIDRQIPLLKEEIAKLKKPVKETAPKKVKKKGKKT